MRSRHLLGLYARCEAGRYKAPNDVGETNHQHASEDRIFAAGLCTAMHLDVLTSYRVEKASALRLAGVIRARDRAL